MHPQITSHDERRPALGPIALCVKRSAAPGVFFLAGAAPLADPAEAARAAYERIAAALSAEALEIVQERVFGSLDAAEAILAARLAALVSGGVAADGPLTFVEGRPPWGDGLAGVILHAVRRQATDGGVYTLVDGDRPCGRVWHSGGVKHAVLQQITPAPGDCCETVAVQTARVIERAALLLGKLGLSLRDVVRTWFYVADIGRTYGEFNRGRTMKFRECGLMPGPGEAGLWLPASTGIGARLRGGAALSLDLLAVAGAPGAPVVVTPLRNPVQQDAFAYGSAFSRGMLVRTPGLALVQVSGTAAIDEAGRSLHAGDMHAQVVCTLDKIEALLRTCGAGLAQICAATAFVKHPDGAACFRAVLRERGLENLPAVCVVAEICRDELLFELDTEVSVAECGGSSAAGA